MKKTKFNLDSEIEKIIKKFNLNNSWNKEIIRDIKKYNNKNFKKKLEVICSYCRRGSLCGK